MSSVAVTPARRFGVHYCPLPGTRSVGVAITVLRQHPRSILFTLSVSQLLGMETVYVIVLYRVLYYMSSRYHFSTFLNHLQGFQFSRKSQVSWLILA